MTTSQLDKFAPKQPKPLLDQPSQSVVAKKRSLFDPEIVVPAIWDSFRKLSPVHMVKNPVMFVTEVGAAVTTVGIFFAKAHGEPFAFVLQTPRWRGFTCC